MKALDVMCAALVEAQARGHVPQVATHAQLTHMSRGNFGRIETIQIYGKQGVIRIVCTNGALDLHLGPENMRALEVLAELECNAGDLDVRRVEMAPEGDYGGRVEVPLAVGGKVPS